MRTDVAAKHIGNESRGCTSIALEDIKKRIHKLRGED
nr:MAG TPA_asm: hypothetical protein [Caudoviricetes sp.]